jgi:restriction system protein
LVLAGASPAYHPIEQMLASLIVIPLFVGLLILWLLSIFAADPAFKGRLGEIMVSRIGLKQLDPALYRTFGDIYLPRPYGKGTTQIDHIVVSPFGIFVIETKNYKGWIFGSEKQRQWTQQIYKAKHRFQNPLHQNMLHVKALQRFLCLSDDRFHPVVMFIGDTQFKTPLPGNVLNRGLLPWIRNHTATLLDPSAVQRANALLDDLHRSTDRKAAAREHLKALQTRNA